MEWEKVNIIKIIILGSVQLLLASYAFVNKFPLVYIPQCGLWSKEYGLSLNTTKKLVNGTKYF
jgi:hypothetical protein